jgi:hypothetical protein
MLPVEFQDFGGIFVDLNRVGCLEESATPSRALEGGTTPREGSVKVHSFSDLLRLFLF